MDRIDNIENDPTKSFRDFIDGHALNIACRYVVPEDMKTNLQLSSSLGDKQLNILHFNIHSLPNKINLLRDLILKLRSIGNNLDIILICETFINEKNKKSCSLDDLNYTLFEEHRMNNSQGGVAIYVNKTLNCHERRDLKIFKEGKIESCFIEIKIGSDKVVFGEMYRVPGHGEAEFIADYEHILNKIKSEG
jgi:exonuclease III